MFHRLWECEACQDDRVELVGMEMIQYAREACESNSADLINFLTGTFAHPGDYVPPPISQQGMDGVQVENFEQGYLDSGLVPPGPELVRFEGSIILDGSCFQSVVRELARAGWAFVFVSNQGHMLARVFGPAWAHLPQSSQAGEFSALAAAGVNLDGPASLLSDCASVVSVCARNPGDRLGGQRAYTGSVLEAFSGAGPNLEGVVKVAAHKDAAETGISALESWRRSGNDLLI